MVAERPSHNYYGHLGIADGMSIARVWACWCSKRPPRRGGRFEYRHAHTHAMDMPSAMPICSYGASSQVRLLNEHKLVEDIHHRPTIAAV